MTAGRRRRAALAAVAVVALLPARTTLAQPCDPAAALVLDAVGGETADLRREHDKGAHTLEIVDGNRTFTAPFDAPSSSFNANLRGLTIASADLSTLTLRLSGYRFVAKPPYTQRQRSTCVAHIEVAPFRTWDVSVTATVPAPASGITVQVQSPTGAVISTTATSTAVLIPRGLRDWGRPLDWATRLTLEVFPSPGDREDHYTVPLRADRLAAGTDANNNTTACRSEPGRLCHSEEDIRKILRSKVKAPNETRGNEWGRAARQLQGVDRINALKIVKSIEFELVRQ